MGEPNSAPALGPTRPVPRAPVGDHLERRWLHYAFRSPAGDVSVIANLSSLGASGARSSDVQHMSILIVHDASGWHSTQFNAEVIPRPWSAFQLPESQRAMRIAGRRGHPAIDLNFTRTGRACTSQCAPFGTDQHLRWQSEPGIWAVGDVLTDRVHAGVRLIGYHERVRGRWGWPDLGGWVFGFANAASSGGDAPAYSVVFTLIQPLRPADAATGSVMLWRQGRLLRHFPRRRVDVAVHGLLPRDAVHTCPPLAATLGTPPAPEVPRDLAITASMGADRLALVINAETAGRIVNPSELGLLPFSVHEVLGPCTVTGHVADRDIAFTAGAVVEFAGGADVD
jgi:hypothetical protein